MVVAEEGALLLLAMLLDIVVYWLVLLRQLVEVRQVADVRRRSVPVLAQFLPMYERIIIQVQFVVAGD